MVGLRRFFGVDEKGSSISTEILAGVSTFLSLSYIFIVNPAILGRAGMDKGDVLFATIVASALATLVMGLWARLPFVLAPGMEMNAYVAFFVVGSLGFTWQQALGAVFWSGVLFIILTVLKVRQKIIDAVPLRMKSGLSLSVGTFLGLIALNLTGILRYEGVTLQGIGDFFNPLAYVLFFSLSIVLLLEKLRVRGSVLISIILASFFCHAFNIGLEGEEATELSENMFAGIGQLDISIITQPKMLSVILILFFD